MRAALLATVAQVVLFLLAAVAPRPAAAEPRFALRQGAPCAMCHVDPAGGGMRNDYGRGVYSAAKLAADWATPAAGQGVFDGRLSDGVAAGSDVRLLYQHLHRSDADQPRMDSFYLMQAALYVGADLSPSTTLYVAPTFHGGQEVTVAASALVRLPVEGAYIRAGRFTPAYGLKLVNHSTFVRKQLGVGLRAEDAGVEFGWDAGPASIQLSAVNGAADGSDGWDDNQLMGFWGRVAHRFGGPRLRLLAGASGGHTVTGLGPDEDPRGDEGRVADQRAGVFGGLSAGRLAHPALSPASATVSVPRPAPTSITCSPPCSPISSRTVSVRISRIWGLGRVHPARPSAASGAITGHSSSGTGGPLPGNAASAGRPSAVRADPAPRTRYPSRPGAPRTSSTTLGSNPPKRSNASRTLRSLSPSSTSYDTCRRWQPGHRA